MIMSILKGLWHWAVMVPTANLLYVFLYATKSVPLAIIGIVGTFRLLSLPSTINNIKHFKLSKSLQDSIKSTKDKKLKKKLKRKLKAHNKRSFWKTLLTYGLILPFMIATYQLVLALQTKGIQAFAPYLLGFTKMLSVPAVGYTIFGIDLTQAPNLALNLALAISVALSNLVNLVLFNSGQGTVNMLEKLQSQLKLPGADENDYKILAKVMHFSRYSNVFLNAALITIILAKFPAIFGFYTMVHNAYNVLITLILWVIL